MSFRFVSLICANLFLVSAAVAGDPPSDRRVVVVVWDGMRPDFVSAETTPNLWRLAGRGVFFAHHHPVFLSATEANGTAIATGAYPQHSLVFANVTFRPTIDPENPVGSQDPETVRKGDLVSGGHYLGRPTVAEILHGHGRATAIAGSKQVALLHDRAPRDEAAGASPILYQGATLPASLAAELVRAYGVFPLDTPGGDKSICDRWTTQSLIGTLWRDGVPAYSLLWLAEPDSSQHATGPGSTQSLAAIKSSDANIGLVLADLDRRALLDSTDVMVVSDHGFSTISRSVDVAAELARAGFRAKRAALGDLKPGEVLVVTGGGSTLLYVGDHDPAVCQRLAVYLQARDWTGVVFSRAPIEGTFPLAEAKIDAPHAPDLVVSLQWKPGLNAAGAPGLLTIDVAAASKNVGSHASLSPYDMHNTLVAAGPDFRRGVVDTLPSANTDLAPTILWCLGYRSDAQAMDGRVLSEALRIDAPSLKSYEIRRLTAKRATAGGEWCQYLKVSEVNGVRYLDEGNGALSAVMPSAAMK